MAPGRSPSAAEAKDGRERSPVPFSRRGLESSAFLARRSRPMEHLQSLALAAGLAWASGVRLYAAIFIVGLLGRLGYVHLPEHLLLLEHNGVLIASAIM